MWVESIAPKRDFFVLSFRANACWPWTIRVRRELDAFGVLIANDNMSERGSCDGIVRGIGVYLIKFLCSSEKIDDFLSSIGFPVKIAIFSITRMSVHKEY